jgi:hypothetical protein
MPYQQRDLVWIIDAQMPDGTQKTHPFLILSCSAAISKEPGYYYGVMMTTSNKPNKFSKPVTDDMFEGRLPKPGSSLRLYIISSFVENAIGGLITRMNRIDFLSVLDEIKNYVLVAD